MLISATEARKNFFELLNRVIYGGEEIYITKSGAKTLVRIEKVDTKNEGLMSFAGFLSDKDAKLMKREIKKSRIVEKRKTENFKG